MMFSTRIFYVFMFSFVLLSPFCKVSLAVTSLDSIENNASIQTQKPYDLTFIDEMTEHHRMGVEMAEMAVEKAHHSELRELAKKMVKAQLEEIKIMQHWRKNWYPHADEFESHAVGMRMEELERLSGNAFDVAFLDSMIMHHPGAIYLGHESQKRGKHSKLRNLGRKIASDQIKELDTMRHWRHHWHNH